jgi:hypothetical protein
MQYLVEGSRGPLPPSPEQAIALLEGTVIPAFEHMTKLKAEGKLLAGGLPVGDRAFVCIIEAGSNDEADRIRARHPDLGNSRVEGDAAAELRGARRDRAQNRRNAEIGATLTAQPAAS